MAAVGNNSAVNKNSFKSPILNLNLVKYLKSLPMDYLTKSPWVSRQNTRCNLVPYTASSSPSPCSPNRPTTSASSSAKLSRHVSSSPTASQPTGHLNSEGVSSQIDEQNQNEQIILSVCWYREYLGAAFYDASTRQAYVIEDKAESAPEFWILKTIFREISPKILLLGGKQDNRLFEVVKELRGIKTDGSKELGSKKTTSESSENQGSSSKGSLKRKSFHSESSSTSNSESPIFGTQGSTSSSGTVTSSVALVIRPAAEFKYESCCKRVLLYPWPGLSRESSDLERESWIRCKFNINAVAAVRALGGLLKFLEQKGNEILAKNSLFGTSPILGLHSYHMDDLVHVDEATVAFLQVFSEDLHPAASKNGKSSASKEGLSLFALLSRTASSLSSHVLRRMILRPIRNSETLESRYNFLCWALKPANFDSIRQLQSCFKNICNVQLLFSRLQRGQLSVKDWKDLYQSLANLVIITEICSAQDDGIDAFKQVSESKSEELYQATYLIQRTMDFEQSERAKRFVVKPGLDHGLDDQKRKFSGLEEVLTQISSIELTNLPADIKECIIIYFPHIGFLLVIESADAAPYLTTNVTCQGENSTVSETYEIPGLSHAFSSCDRVYFKSEGCYALDNEFGDLEVEIANRETSIMMRLIETILLQSQTFINLVSKALYIDVLLAFASVSRDLGWVKPTLNTSGNFLVKEGRHPLYEVCNPTFVSNDIFGRVKECPVSIITGPNSSGKTAYIKQVGVIAYLAHLGCFVPVEEMSFHPLDAILSVAMVTPSVTSGISTFMFDLNRLTITVCGSTNRSLVLIDEFGSSTYEFDGASLLASVVDFWTSQIPEKTSIGETTDEETTGFSRRELKTAMVTRRELSNDTVPKGCPLVFVSTHFYRLHHFLQHPQLVKELCMDTLQEENKVIHLYQVTEGRTNKSYALQVALAAGLPSALIGRAKEIHNVINSSTIPSHWKSLCGSEELQRCADIVQEFLSHDLNSAPLLELIAGFRKYLNFDDTSNTSISLGNSSDFEKNSPSFQSFTNPNHQNFHESNHMDIDPNQRDRDFEFHDRDDENPQVSPRPSIMQGISKALDIQESQAFDIISPSKSVGFGKFNSTRRKSKAMSLINLYKNESD